MDFQEPAFLCVLGPYLSSGYLGQFSPLGPSYDKGFPSGLESKESACNAGDLSSIPGSGRSPGEGIGYPLQYSWGSLVAHLVENPPAMWETWVQSLVQEDPLEKGMATTPVFLPGESHGQRSLAGYSP